MTIETKEASPPGGAECPPPPTSTSSNSNPTHPRKRSKVKLMVKKTEVGDNPDNNANDDPCTSAMERLQVASISETDMKNDRIPPNGVRGVPIFTTSEIIANGDKSPTPSSSGSGGDSVSGAGSQQATPPSGPSSRKRGTKRSKKGRDGPKGDSSSDSRSGNVPCRKSKRLLFRNNHKTLAEKRLSGDESADSISPYGRLVELIDHQPELDREDFLTKCLFLGSLDLAFTDHGTPQLPATNNTDLKNGTRSSFSTPKRIFNVKSLKTLCILNIIKRKKHEFVQRETEQDAKSGPTDENDNPEESGLWLNFGEYLTNLMPPTEAVVTGFPRTEDNVPWEEWVEKLQRCGTVVTLSGTSSTNRAQDHGEFVSESRTTADCDEGKWFNWGEHMTKMLQIESSIISKQVVMVQPDLGASFQQKSRKIARRKQTVRA